MLPAVSGFCVAKANSSKGVCQVSAEDGPTPGAHHNWPCSRIQKLSLKPITLCNINIEVEKDPFSDYYPQNGALDGHSDLGG